MKVIQMQLVQSYVLKGLKSYIVLINSDFLGLESTTL